MPPCATAVCALLLAFRIHVKCCDLITLPTGPLVHSVLWVQPACGVPMLPKCRAKILNLWVARLLGWPCYVWLTTLTCCAGFHGLQAGCRERRSRTCRSRVQCARPVKVREAFHACAAAAGVPSSTCETVRRSDTQCEWHRWPARACSLPSVPRERLWRDMDEQLCTLLLKSLHFLPCYPGVDLT